MILKILLFVYLLVTFTNLYCILIMVRRLKLYAPTWYKEKANYTLNIIYSIIPICHFKFLPGNIYVAICSVEKLKSILEEVEEFYGD
ncbi:MAG: hypothetical protein ACRCTZ_21085 [Sarcina sp.]